MWRNFSTGFQMVRLAFLAVLGLALAACVPTVLPPLGQIGSEPGYLPGRLIGAAPEDRAELAQYRQDNIDAIRDVWAREDRIRRGAEPGGCIGEHVFTCVASLSQRLTVSDYWREATLFRQPGVDVNGKPLPPPLVLLSAYLPAAAPTEPGTKRPMIQIGIEADAERRVRNVSVLLPSDPMLQSTAADYARTGLYEVLAAVARPSCPNLQPLEVYRFFENEVKPQARSIGERKDKTLTDTTITRSSVANATYCGRKLYFQSESGVSTRLAKFPKHYGAFADGLIVVQ
jgi:hypothetical protein